MTEDRAGVESFVAMGKVVLSKLEGDRQHLLEVSSALEQESRVNERLNTLLRGVKT
jgi:hypothetical protein